MSFDPHNRRPRLRPERADAYSANWPNASDRSLEDANQSRRLDAGLPPGRGGADEERGESRLARGRLDIAACVREAHCRAEMEVFALERLDREDAETAFDHRAPARGDNGPKIAKIAERVGGEDAVEGARRRARQELGRVGRLEAVIEAAQARLGDHGGREVHSREAVDA